MLDSANINVHGGEIHGLLGQNGSGKSTLIKILSGFYAPDPGGSLVALGQPVPLPVQNAHKYGLSFVHQDLALVDSMTVLENMRLGRYRAGFGWHIDWKKERLRVSEMSARFGLEIDPNAPVGELRDVERALVAILRALDRLEGLSGGLLVLDEPTAYLPLDGVDRLFEAVGRVAREGFGVIFVTHRLEEAKAITNRITVLRDGKVVGTHDTDSTTRASLMELILGRSIANYYPDLGESTSTMALDVRELSGRGVTKVSFQARAGEILGLTGLLGMGYERVPYLLFGADQAGHGDIEIGGRQHGLTKWDPRHAMHAGLALLPGNRLRAGGLASATVLENVTLPVLPRFFRLGLLRLRQQFAATRKLLESFNVRPPEPAFAFSMLSGGNQQKALVAKWFETKPHVLMFHEPTQGVDVGSKPEIFRHIRVAAERGVAVVIASCEYEDLAHLCHRVLVFRNGKIQSELRGRSLTHERIVEECFQDRSISIENPST